MKKKINYLKNESGFYLSGGCAKIAYIVLGVGFIIGLIIGAFSGDWYMASICGFILVINMIIALFSFIINKIRNRIHRIKNK